MMGPDAIILSIPREEPFHGVARLVVGGLAARYELSYEHLEDLQLALASVLENDGYAAGTELTVRVEIHPDSLSMAIGPLRGQEVRSDLESEAQEGISLHRLLSTLVDTVEVEKGEGGDWLRLEKRVPLTHPPAHEPDQDL
jgi:anti-sigma regulatory factor (Ser/Thr protein kinase)